MDDGNSQLREKLVKSLRESAAAKVALDRAEGKIKGVPHYTVIEDAADDVGREVSRLVQQLHLTELVADQSLSGKCPECGTRCDLELKKRKLTSGAGSVELLESTGHCPCCRRAFFPSAGSDGV